MRLGGRPSRIAFAWTPKPWQIGLAVLNIRVGPSRDRPAYQRAGMQPLSRHRPKTQRKNHGEANGGVRLDPRPGAARVRRITHGMPDVERDHHPDSAERANLKEARATACHCARVTTCAGVALAFADGIVG